MIKTTLGKLATQNGRCSTFMMRKKLYTFVDIAKEIVPTTYIGLVLIVAGIVFNEYLVKSKK